MTIRFYKISTLVLACLLVGLALAYFSLYRQIVTAAFVSHHSEICKQSVRGAEAGLTSRDRVLHDLAFFVGYYDGYTNTLRGFPLLSLLRTDRDRTVAAAVAYLRKHSTKDYGDDPYEWIKDY